MTTTGDALKQCFISPNVSDSNFEPANLVDVGDRIARSLSGIMKGITDPSASPLPVGNGYVVGNVVEAMIYTASNLGRIADSISELADAVSRLRAE